MPADSKSPNSPSTTFGPELSALREELARNVHESWMKLRLSSGWRVGPLRDDARKEHPDLVPFDELPDSEKEYDRQTAQTALRTLLSLGYTIQPPTGGLPISWESSPGDAHAARERLARLIGDPSQHDRATLQRLWLEHDRNIWSSNVEAYRTVAQRILKLGEPLLAYDVVAEGIKNFPSDTRLRQLLALALARSGATESANAVLYGLLKEGHRDEETVGLLARTHKDLAREAVDPQEQTKHFRLAYEFYSQAYKDTGGYWSGINAATVALLIGERDEAAALARRVQQQCRSELASVSQDDRYWLLSTLGEASLVLENWGEAESWYSQALELARGNWGSLQSTRHNALLLLKHMGRDPQLIDQIFRVPAVAVFSGHMIDRPDRPVPRFPSYAESEIKRAIAARLEKVNAGFGYASVACGSDILFHEAILEKRGESHIVLPYEKQFFVEDSVNIADNPRWATRCDAIMARAVQIIEASKHSQMCGHVSYLFSNLMLHGLASVHAQQLETKLVPMVVWDGQPGDGPDGTAGTVGRWQSLGLEVEIIDLRSTITLQTPAGNAKPATVTAASVPAIPRASAPPFTSEIRALLFADAHGFSELSDEQVPLFVQHFLGMTGEMVAHSAHKPLIKNTWGDGLYFVFSNVHDAGEFALNLRDGVCCTDWPARGLPSLNLRIGLHAGPVYSCTDPVTLQATYIGSHVSRAARIEPITPTGQVYASQSFAALAAAECVRDFRCDYVGQTPMAKKYGVFPTYVVQRSAGPR